jgi:hypothetical protein
LRAGAAFVRRRNNGQIGVLLQRLYERTQARGVNPVVVGNQNVRHEISAQTQRLPINPFWLNNGEDNGRDDWI